MTEKGQSSAFVDARVAAGLRAESGRRREAEDGEHSRLLVLVDGRIIEMFGLSCRVFAARAAGSLLDRRPDPARLLG
jgi:hypothetical protein